MVVNYVGCLGGSPGLVVMRGDSCSEGREFESRHRILDGHFSNIFVVKIVMFERTKIDEKEGEHGPFFKRILCWLFPTYLKSSLILRIKTYFELENFP